MVRQDKREKLYYYSQAGKIAPNLPAGQAWIKSKMQPLERFSITELAAGFPPEVKPLTQQPDPARDEKPLTEKSKNFWEL